MSYYARYLEGLDGGVSIYIGSSYITETNYDQFVIELEQLARELWPDKFKPRTLKDWADEFKGEVKDHTQDFELIHHSDGSTECRDKRMNQIPINSQKKNG